MKFGAIHLRRHHKVHSQYTTLHERLKSITCFRQLPVFHPTCITNFLLRETWYKVDCETNYNCSNHPDLTSGEHLRGGKLGKLGTTSPPIWYVSFLEANEVDQLPFVKFIIENNLIHTAIKSGKYSHILRL